MQVKGWQDVAASCGLQVVETSGSSDLIARAGALEVRIEDCQDKRQRAQIVVVVPGPPDFADLSIRTESLNAFPGMPEIEIGDAAFDRRFLIAGPPRMVFALLDVETRRLLLGLLLRVSPQSRLEISCGELRLEISRQGVPGILPLLLDAGRRLARSLEMDVPRRLAQNAKRDPEARVRLENLLVLIREHSGDPDTVEVLRTACLDTSPEIRLRAAKALGSEGRDTLLKLAEGNVNDTLSAEAMLLLERELPFERTKAILDRAVTSRRIQTARVCLKALGRSGAAAIDTLAKVVAYEKLELAVAAVQALEGIGSPAEPPLIVALRREQKDVRMAAAYALGRVGSVTAVLPLKEAAERSSRDPQILRATSLAIAEIQSRIQGASPGQLSLAATEAGQLSLAEAEAGQLSLATDTGGQLSVPDSEEG